MKNTFFSVLALLVVAVGISAFAMRPETAPDPQPESLNIGEWHEVFLCTETDQCSGSLSVEQGANGSGNFKSIPRGQTISIDVKPNSDGYWRWKCGSSPEQSRAIECYRKMVTKLTVTHSTNGRTITWKCYAKG